MKTLLLTVLLSLSFALPVWSQPPMFLRDGPIRHFNDDDMALFKQTLDTALDTQPDKTPLNWHNAKTNSQGSITPLNTKEKNDLRCRQTLIVNTAKGLTREAIFTLCQAQDGRWLFAE